MKEEFDQTRARLHDEVSAALKPSKTAGVSNGTATAWKKVEPLEKAVETASADVQRKMTKVSTLLTKLTEDLPLIIQVLEEPEREKELIERIDTLDSELEMAQAESATLASEIERVSDLLKTSEAENQQMKETIQDQQKLISKQQDTCGKFSLRCDDYKSLVQMGSEIIQTLEAEMFSPDLSAQNSESFYFHELVTTDQENEIYSLYEELNALRQQQEEQRLQLLEAEEDIRKMQDDKDALVGSAMNAIDVADQNSTEMHAQVLTLSPFLLYLVLIPSSRR